MMFTYFASSLVSCVDILSADYCLKRLRTLPYSNFTDSTRFLASQTACEHSSVLFPRHKIFVRQWLGQTLYHVFSAVSHKFRTIITTSVGFNILFGEIFQAT